MPSHPSRPIRALFICSLTAALALPTTAPALDTFTTGVTISDSDASVADLFVQDKTVLDGRLCVGNGCVTGEVLAPQR